MQRDQQKQQTRQNVVDAASFLFAERGLAKTRTADIAKHAGISHGAVFVHFRTREALLAEVVLAIGRSITDRLHALILENADLETVLRAHLNCLQEHESSYASFLRESRLLPRDTLRSWVGVQSAISVHMSQPATKAMQMGLIREMPLHLVFNTWIGLVHHYLMNRELFAPGKSVIKKHANELIDHFIGLLRRENE